LTFAFTSPYYSTVFQERAMTLTKRQKEVLDFLVVFLNKHGYSPSFEEIARSLKLTSLGHGPQTHHDTGAQRIRAARLQPEPVD